MAGLTIEEQQRVKLGAQSFADELRSASPDLFTASQPVASMPIRKDDTFFDEFSATVGQLATTKFSDSLQSLMENDDDGDGGALLSSDGGKSIGFFIMRAFQKRLCNPQSEADLKAQIDTIKSAHGLDINPSAAGISGGASTAVAIAVGTMIGSGPLAVVLAPLAGAVAWLLLLVGVDTFCGWAASKG
jgi:hypothetical protein